jgi:hypothetical protein
MLVRRATALVLLITSTACTTVRRVESPREFLNTRTPAKIWVSTGDSELTEVQSPRILADTIFGFSAAAQPVVFPIAAIRELRTKQISSGRTAGLIGLLVVGSIASIAIWQGVQGDAPSVEETEDFRPRFKIRIGW